MHSRAISPCQHCHEHQASATKADLKAAGADCLPAWDSSLLVAAAMAPGAGSLSGMCTAGHLQGKQAAEAGQSNQTGVIPQHHPQDAIEFIEKEFQS